MFGFSVGDIVGIEVKIGVLELSLERVKAKVVDVSPFWAERGFYIDQMLELEQPMDEITWWIINSPKGLPWFVLNHAGRFEHYR